jgi:hypothetical protein
VVVNPQFIYDVPSWDVCEEGGEVLFSDFRVVFKSSAIVVNNAWYGSKTHISSAEYS